MASKTPLYELPYPQPGDPARIEQAVQPLAEALDRRLELLTAMAAPQAGVLSRRDFEFSFSSNPPMAPSISAGVAWLDVRNSALSGRTPFISSATTPLTFAPPHATLARLDQVWVRVPDGTKPSSAEIAILPGTPTAGTTLDNRNGAAAPPSGGGVRLYDVLVPAGSTGLFWGNVRDRRPWVRGFHFEIGTLILPGGASSSTPQDILSDLHVRLECTADYYRVGARLPLRNNGPTLNTALLDAGAGTRTISVPVPANTVLTVEPEWLIFGRGMSRPFELRMWTFGDPIMLAGGQAVDVRARELVNSDIFNNA